MRFHPQIIDSLFAIKIFLLFFVNKIVGAKPDIPGIAEIVISEIFSVLTSDNYLKFLYIFFF